MTTAVLNVLMVAASAVTGLMIARALGPSGRGEYAAVIAWFGIALIVGELGQSTALCYFVASDPQRARSYVSTTRRIMVISGVVTAVLGWFLAPVLARDRPTLTTCYRVMFATCVLSYVGATFVFALQARNIRMWNVVRAVQPFSYLLVIVVLHTFWRVTLMGTIVTLVITIVIQSALAYLLCGRVNLLGGVYDNRLARPLLRFGISQLAGSAPTSVNGRLDQLILSTTTSFQNLGLYAVAVSVTSLAAPVVSAIGSVLFPRIAAQKEGSTRQLETRAVQASAAVSIAIMAVVALTAPWLVPFFFGHAYSSSVKLIWILAVGAVFLGCGQVIGDLLRGRGQPLAVAIGQGVGAVITVALLAILLPLWGITGAAVASSVAYLATFAVLYRLLRQPVPPRPVARPQPALRGGE